MPDKTKFERELDEILEKTERESEKSGRKRDHRSFEPFSPSVPKSTRPKNRKPIVIFNPGQLVIVGLVILAIAAFISTAQVPIAVTGFVIMGIGYVLWFGKGNRFAGSFKGVQTGRIKRKPEPEVKHWRGRRIEDKPKSRNKGKIIDFGSPDDEDSTKS
jgi:hypothetical protein